ncbi:MAG: hypothetical protein ACJ8AO_20280 [Gemmatimonadaceae bacterium]
MRTIGNELSRRIPEVMGEAASLAGECATAQRLRAGVDELAATFAALLRWAFGDPDDAEGRRAAAAGAVAAAVAHGRAGRPAGLDEDAVLHEYDLLRRAALRVVLRLGERDVPRVYEVMARLDDAISVATRAALLGYYAPEFEARGDWSHRLHALCAEAEPAGHWGRRNA